MTDTAALVDQVPLAVDTMPARRPRRAPRGLLVVSVVVGVAFALPIGYIAWRNITLGSDVFEVLFSADTLWPLWRTIVLATSVSVTTAVLGTALAWAVNRTDLPGRGLWRVLAPLPLVFPSFVGAAALITAFAPGGLAESLLEPVGVETLPTFEGLSGSWLVLTLFTYPFVYLPVAARLRALSPSLEESARLLGHSPVSVFGTVVLPQAARAISAGALLVFLYTVSDFGVVQLMGYNTLTRQIFLNQPFNLPVAFALALILGVFAIVVVVLERQVSSRLAATTSVKARQPLQVPLRRWRWPVFALVVAFIGNALIAPVLALGWWAWRGLSNADDASARLGEDLADLVAPAVNTAVVSVISAVVAVAVVLPVAYLTTRYRSRPGAVANAFVVGGFALPGISVALAMVFWSLNAPVLGALYQTIPLLIFSYVVHFGAQSMRASQVAVGAMPLRLDDAARMLGAGRVRRLVTIELPVMAPGLLAGAGLVLLSVMKELPATLLLSPPGFETLATQIWGSLEGGFLSQVGLASLVLVALSGVLTWVLVVRRSDALD
jgi:iron(III) transport system permease protein